MTDAAYSAKNWLMRTDELEEKRQRALQRKELIEEKINNSVSCYEITGRRDPIGAQAKREDLLMNYSTACEELEKITHIIIHEDIKTYETIEKLQNSLYKAVLVGRYINRLTITQLTQNRKIEYKKSQLYVIENKALEQLADVLET